MQKSIILVGANGFWSLKELVNATLFHDRFELVYFKDFKIEQGKNHLVVAVVVADQPFGPDIMDKFPNLKTIARTGTGYDNIDVEVAHKRGIVVTRVAGLNAEAVSDFALALMFSLSRSIVKMHNDMSCGKWEQLRQGMLLSEMTVGIVGLGHIGRLLSRKLNALNVRRILGYNRTLRPEIKSMILETYLDFVSLEEVMSESDMVIISIALAEETKHLIDRHQLSLMKNTACLINVSRGAVVDEDALAKCVAEKWIAGVALDVFSSEPPADDIFEKPFFQKLIESSKNGANVILTSHNAGITRNSVKNISLQVAKNTVNVLDKKFEAEGLEIV